MSKILVIETINNWIYGAINEIKPQKELISHFAGNREPRIMVRMLASNARDD